VAAAIYCRISRDRTGAGLGVERQEQDCRALAERLDLPVEIVLVDNDLSAYSGKKRPDYERLLEGLRAGRYSAVIVWHPDRLHRSPAELERFIDVIEAARVQVHTVTAGDVDLATASGRMTARIVGAVARHESEHRSERLKRKHLQLAEMGLPSGGSRPFGYEADGLTVREDEAELVREMCSRFLAGASLHSIATDLNRRGVATSGGKLWGNQNVRQTIDRRRNAGLRERYDETFGLAAWPAIVSTDVWMACHARLADPSRRTSFSNARAYLLTGLAVCGKCGATVRGTSRAGGALIYKCRNACLSRSMAPMDRMVSAAVVALLSDASARRLFVRPETGRDYVGEATVLRARMRDAAKLYARGAIDLGTLEEIKRDIDVQLDKVSEAAATQPTELAGLPGTVAEVRARWAALSLDRKRAVIAKLLVVTILPTKKGSRFGPSSVRLQPR
jgi:site-specific DNA recombinase